MSNDSPLVQSISQSTGLDSTSSAQAANTAAALVVVPFTVMHRPAGNGGPGGSGSGTTGSGGSPSTQQAMMSPSGGGMGGGNGNNPQVFNVTPEKLVAFLAATAHIRQDQAARVLTLVGAELLRITQVAVAASGEGKR